MRHGELLALDSQGFHHLHYQEWGSAGNERVLICVHGLARNGRDFDELAQALSRNYRVVCPDLPGRGRSDWLSNPADYSMPQYLQDMAALIAHLGVKQVDWVGTSLGGLIGVCLAALSNSPIRSLVLNDIGPFVPQSALQRISDYLGDPRFDDEMALEAYLRNTYPALSGLAPRQWQHLVAHGQRACDNGQLGLHYDPAIAHNARQAAQQDVDIWPLWRQVDCPQMVLHGVTSDVLSSSVVDQMQQENPQLVVHRLPGICHAPSLMEAGQIALISDWLRSRQTV